MGENSENDKKTREIHFDSNAEIDAGIAELKTKTTWGLQADNKIARQIILEYLRGNEKDEDKELLKGMKEITVAYKGKCLKDDNCIRENPEIQVGERALYAKGVGLLCLECRDVLEDRGDPDLTRKHLRMRRTERLLKQLEEKVEVKSQQLEAYQLPERQVERDALDKKLAERLDEYLRVRTSPNPNSILSREEETKMLDLMFASHLEVDRSNRDIALIIEQNLKKRKTRKPIEEIQANV